MENLEKHGRPRISVEANKNPGKGYGRLQLTIMAAIAAVMPNIVACASNYEKCAGEQGKTDKAMLEKKAKTCRNRVRRFERRDEGDSEDVLFQEANDACKIANNKTFPVEARLRAALDTAERKDDGEKVEACRKAIQDVRKKGEAAADMIKRLERHQ